MQRGRKEFDTLDARSVPALKIGNEVMIDWNLTNFKNLYGAG
jgi:peroxiredoxin